MDEWHGSELGGHAGSVDASVTVLDDAAFELAFEQEVDPAMVFGTGCTASSPTSLLAGELAELVETFKTELADRVARLRMGGSSRDLADAAQAIEHVVRAGEGLSAAVVDTVDRRGLFLDDGHRDAKAWLRGNVQMAPIDAVRRYRLARFGHANPLAADALESGQVGVAQLNQLALTWANPRVRHDLEITLDIWLICAQLEPFEVFTARLEEWARLTDQDGGFRERDTIHNGRDARMSQVEATMYVRGRFGTLQGDELRQVFEAFCEAEYRLDRDEAKARLGVDHVPITELARTPAQRRADAFHKMVMAAANAPLDDGTPIKVTVDIVIDQATFEQHLLDMLDPLHRHRADEPAAAPPGCGFDPGVTPLADPVDMAGGAPGSVRAMCHTVRGAPIDPADAVTAALIGHVRRVVWGSTSVVVDLGRRARLFTGSSREAVFLQAAIDARDRCVWPGCRHRPRQVDHGLAHHDGGTTCPANGDGCCEHHNLFKTRGYQTRRDNHGRWHTYRPDGTELVAR